MNISLLPIGRSRFQIFIDGKPWKEIHQSIFGKKPKFPSAESLEQLNELFLEVEYQRVKSYLIWRLSSQSYHTSLISKLLIDRLVTNATLKKVMAEFKKLGYFDDQIWLENFMRVHSKRYSHRLIIQKLRQKGIPQEDLQELSSDENESKVITALLISRYAKKNLADQKERQKVILALMRKGFRYEEIIDALNQTSIL